MIAWINFIVLVISTLLTLYFYVKSVGPAALEQKIGSEAYQYGEPYAAYQKQTGFMISKRGRP